MYMEDSLTSTFARNVSSYQDQGDCYCSSQGRRSDFYCISDDDNCDNLLISDVHMMHTSDHKPRYLVYYFQSLILQYCWYTLLYQDNTVPVASVFGVPFKNLCCCDLRAWMLPRCIKISNVVH